MKKDIYINNKVYTGQTVNIEHPNTMLNDQQIKEIKTKIKFSTDSFNKIAKEYKCYPAMISSINTGRAYYDRDESYPLRLNKKKREIIKQVIYALKYEFDKSLSDISKEYKIDYSLLCDINNGRLHIINGESYPLRKGRVFSKKSQIAKDIINLLKTSDLEQKDIAKKYNVSTSFVSAVNKGIYYRDLNESYPLRDNYQQKNSGRVSQNRKDRCLSPNEINEIENKLANSNIGIRKIAQEYDVSFQTISQINIGAIIKYRNNNIKYPIRKIMNK